LKHILPIICFLIIFLPLIFSNGSYVKAQEDNDLPILEAELVILEDVPLLEFGEETTIGLRFKQSGFNWTKLSERGFFFAKIYLPIVFRSIIYLLGYNSVVFEAEIVGNPPGWEAWVSPSSVTYFTGDSQALVDLYVKVSRPTSANTATVRIRYTAYSGGSNVMGTATTDVLVSVKQYHLAEVTALQQHKEVSPDSVVYFPIEVKNRGNYEDTFEFEVENESNDFLGLVSGHITLKPGETGQVTAMVLTPYVYLYDFGTQTSLNISAHSVYEPEKKFSTSISVTSKGFLISEMFLLTIAIIALIIIVIYLFYYYIFDRQITKLYGRPNKPWKIPKEEKYLKELRKKDKKEYDKTKKMMIDEYQSSMLWYKDHIKNQKNSEKKQINKKQSNGIIKTEIIKNFFNNSRNKNKNKNKNKEKVKNKNNKFFKQEIQNNKKEKSNNKTLELLKNNQKNLNNSLKKFINKFNKNGKKTKEDINKSTLKKDSQKEKKIKLKTDDNNQKEKEKLIKKIKKEEKKQKEKI
jgi:hypothetical protein